MKPEPSVRNFYSWHPKVGNCFYECFVFKTRAVRDYHASTLKKDSTTVQLYQHDNYAGTHTYSVGRHYNDE